MKNQERVNQILHSEGLTKLQMCTCVPLMMCLQADAIAKHSKNYTLDHNCYSVLSSQLPLKLRAIGRSTEETSVSKPCL